MSEPHDDVHEDDLHNPGLKQNKAEQQSPGELLREGRHAHDYSVEDLCAQTKLSPKTVQALEDNDFAALSQPVFARGYYRQCAKVLDLDVERVMAAYTTWAGEPRQQAAPATAVHVIPHDVTPGGGGFRLRGLLVFVLLVVLIGVAAIMLLPSLSSTTGSSTDNNGNTTQILSDNNEGGGDSGSAGQATNAMSAGHGDSLSTSADASGEPGDTPAVAGKADAAQATTGHKPGGRNVNRTLGITPPGQNDSTAAANDNGKTQPAVDPNHLKLVFNKRSWVRVTDANGNRMASGIFEAGDSKEFDGQPPYHITLGFAPGVAVTIGGQAVDVASQTGSGSIAHLTVKAPDNNS